MERLNLAKRWMFSIPSLHGPPQSDAPYSQLWSLFAFARLDWRTGHVRDDVALRYRPRSPHQNRNRQPNQDNEYERPKSIGENGVHTLTMRLPEFDCYAFQRLGGAGPSRVVGDPRIIRSATPDLEDHLGARATAIPLGESAVGSISSESPYMKGAASLTGPLKR